MKNTLTGLARLYALTAALAALAPSAAAQYCSASYDAATEWIERVELVGVGSNISGSGGAGYQDFTGTVFSLTPGQSYTVEADVMTTFQSGGDFRLDLWIDYDRDSVFSASEAIEIAPQQFYVSNVLHTRSTTFDVPLSAAAGATRMRVGFRFVVGPTAADPCSPCGTPCFGQVEDYGIDMQPTAGICDSEASSADFEFISEVSLGGIVTPSGPSTYTDNTSTLIPMVAGASRTLSVDVENTTPNARSVHVTAWVDFDRDEVFEPSEQFVVASSAAIGPGTTQFTSPIPVPASVVTPTRMRVAVKNVSGGPPGPCDTGFLGEVEDYGVSIASYCVADYDAASDWIERVEIVGIGGRTSGAGGPGYEDFSGTSLGLLGAGLTYTIEADVMTTFSGGGTFRLDLWIDANNDGMFDNSELTLIAPPQFYPENVLHTRSNTFTLPAFVTDGDTRMRVSFRAVAGGSAPDPCSPCGTCFGQVEDHGLEVSNGRARSYCDRSPNSVDPVGAAISATGSLSISDNTMVLSSTPVPNTTGLYFFGTTQVNTPFGAGRRCVGGQTRRLLPPSQAQNNVALRPLDFTTGNESAIQPGSTMNFQYWFRDPMMGGFNLSDGLEVFFVQ